MLLPLDFNNLKNVAFPVYGLNTDEYIYRDGLLVNEHTLKVLDDKNQSGETLGLRRLQTPHKLEKLQRSFPDFGALLFNTRRPFYIDNKGRAFEYKKTFFAKIKYLKILKVVKKDIASVIVVEGLNSPLVIERPPPLGADYAGILYLKHLPWKVLHYTENKEPDMKKKV